MPKPEAGLLLPASVRVRELRPGRPLRAGRTVFDSASRELPLIAFPSRRLLLGTPFRGKTMNGTFRWRRRFVYLRGRVRGFRVGRSFPGGCFRRSLASPICRLQIDAELIVPTTEPLPVSAIVEAVSPSGFGGRRATLGRASSVIVPGKRFASLSPTAQ